MPQGPSDDKDGRYTSPRKPDAAAGGRQKQGTITIVEWTLDRLPEGLDDFVQDMFSAFEVEGCISTAPEAFLVYQAIWEGFLDDLRKKFLLQSKSAAASGPDGKMRLAVSPMQLFLARIDLSDADLSSEALAKLAKGLYVSEPFLSSWITSDDTSIAGLDLALLDVVPATLLPTTKAARLLLLFRLLSAPPLDAIGDVYDEIRHRLKLAIDDLGSAFGMSTDATRIPANAFLAQCSMPLDGNFLDRHPIDHLLADDRLSAAHGELAEIRRRSETLSATVSSTALCPACGHPHGEIEVPRNAIEIRLIMDRPELARAIAMQYYDEAIERWRTKQEASFAHALDFKKVKAPLCLVIVEGASEEAALPTLALRLNLHLPSRRILIFNAGGKAGVRRHFEDNRANHPTLAMACLVDKDASAWALDVNRTVAKAAEFDRYHVATIANGDFEDLFDRESAVETLNLLYPGIPVFTADAFPMDSRFADIAKKKMWDERRAKFDKVDFARAIAVHIPLEKIPTEIRAFLEQAVRLAVSRSDTLGRDS
jgi:hypothetical protein